MKIALAIVIATVVLAVLTLAGAFGLYVYGGGFSGDLSARSEEWAAFGDYFGGVASPLVGLVSVVLLALTLLLQISQINLQSEEGTKQDMLRYVTKTYDDLDRLLAKEVSIDIHRTVAFGDLVNDLVKPRAMDEDAYSILVRRLFMVNREYVKSLKLYKANVDSYFVYNAYRQRAEEIHKFIVANEKYLEDQNRSVNLWLAGKGIDEL